MLEGKGRATGVEGQVGGFLERGGSDLEVQKRLEQECSGRKGSGDKGPEVGQHRQYQGPAGRLVWLEGSRGQRNGRSRPWFTGFGSACKRSHSLELRSSGCLCCFHSGPPYILRAALPGGSYYFYTEGDPETQGGPDTCSGSHRKDRSQDSNPGLSDSEARWPTHQAISADGIFSGPSTGLGQGEALAPSESQRTRKN